MPWYTTANIINRAARELSLISADVSDPYSSTDANILQLCKLLEGLGQDLSRRYAWEQLTREHSFSTSSGVIGYALPADFLGFVDGTPWNRTDAEPLGPMTPREWQTAKGGSVTSVWQSARIRGRQFLLDPTPSATETVAFEYFSAYWARADNITAWVHNTAYSLNARVTRNTRVYYCTTAGTSVNSPGDGPSGVGSSITDGTVTWAYLSPSTDSATPTLEVPTANTDIVWFDLRLMVLGLKLAFRSEKGLDALWASPDFQRAVDAARGRSDTAPVLSLDGGAAWRLLDASNAPDTGLGS